MRGTLTKLLAVTTLLVTMLSLRATGQCALITDNFSGQVTSSVCAPVSLNMDVRYKFMLPVDPSRVQIFYVWNDGTGATTTVPAISQGDTVFIATASHMYPPADQCSYTAEAYVVFDGQQCVSSSRQEQTFSAWARDNENGAVIITDPVVAQFCEGEDIIDVRFTDNSTFNCNINIEPDKPNRITRWVQFIYGTTTIGGDRIPNITIRDPLGNVFQMTDAAGNSLPPVSGPIVEIPIPADGPTEISWPISAPAGGIAGDIFEITLRNWNICNPYDHNPFDAILPSDLINGDNDPITTTALIEIITTPPVITNPSLEFCAGSPILLTLSTSGGQVNWYTDSLLTNHIHTGNSFNPTGAPTFIDNSTGGSYSFWVTETIGACASAPSRITFRIYDTPAPTPSAGRDTVICDNRYTLDGNMPIVGLGNWSTTSGAIIDNPSDPHSMVRNLAPGPNLLRWTLTNGPCVAVDEVIITSDLQPAPASAGVDQAFCDNSSTALHGNMPTNSGVGTWTVLTGNANFSDTHNPTATASALSGGENEYTWTIRSRYGACLTTSDNVEILRDRTPDPAVAGPDRGVCDSVAVNLAALPAANGGAGTWSVIAGMGVITDYHDPGSLVSGLSFGANQFRWSVISQYGICPGSTDNITLTRDQAPAPALAGMDQDLCSSTTSPLGANAATVGTGTWNVVSSPSPTLPFFNPSVNNPNATAEILAGNEGVYVFAWTIINNSCRTSDTLVVDFGLPVPPADAGPADSICGNSATLSGNNPGIGTGTWQKITGLGTVSYVPAAHSPTALAMINEGEEGYYTFEWRIKSGSCPPSADTVGILYKPMPGEPSISNAERCGTGSVILATTPGINGDINRWYDNATGGAILSESNNFTTPTLSADTDYWISSYNLTTGCESFRKRLDISIHPVPYLPAVSDIQHCGNAGITIPATPGNDGTTNRWYDAPTSGNLLAQADSFTSPLLTASATYWVSSYNAITGCESGRVSVHIQIDPIPGLPVVSDTGRCGEGSVAINSSIGINGTGNRWYNSPVGGILLDTLIQYVTPYLTASRAYWVSSVNPTTGCESPRVSAMAEINPVPAYPTAPDVTQCGPDTVELIAVPGLNGTISRWYDSITNGNMLVQGNNLITEYLSATERYYVSSYNESTRCESSRIEVMAVVLPVPGEKIIIGPSVVGINQTNVIYSVNYQPGSTYEWTVPPGMNLLLENQNFVIVEFPNLGDYNLTVTETNSIGCLGPPANKPIKVKVDVIALDINTTQGEVCVGADLQLSVNPSGGTPSYAFVWGGDTQYLTSVNSSNPVFNSSNAGNYMLTVTVSDINANHISDTIRVTVYPNPVMQIIASDTLICSGKDLPLDVTVSGGSGIYTYFTWSGQTSPLSEIDIRDPVFNTYLRGLYELKLTVEDNNGCQAIDSITILNDAPQAIFISDAVPGCSPVKVSFTNQSDNATAFYWNFGDGDTSILENPTHVFSNLLTSVQYFNVRLTAISPNNCLHNTNEYITVYPNPELSITTYPEKACAPADILLASTPGGRSYNWDFGDGQIASGDFNILHTFANETDQDTAFRIQLISTSFFGCEDTGFTTITVHPSPEASFTADPLSQMIPDKIVAVANTTEDGNWSYLWHFGDDSTSTLRDPGPHDYPGTGDYLIRLIVKGEHCSDSTWTSVEIIPHPPVAAFKPIEPGCMPLTIQFENASAYSTSYLWEFGDGAVSNKPSPEYTYYEWGTYKIKLTAWGEDGSTDSYSANNDVYVLPNAFFEIAPRTVYVNEQAVHFFNQSDNGDYPEEGNTYLWDFGDGSGSEEMNPTHLYTKDGNYDVTLNVWTDKGCYDLYEYSTAVLVKPTGKIYFPNVFSPGAGLPENRTFKPAILDYVEAYHLMIFNRWGELIFESFNQETGWDGIVDGKVAKEDVYIWKVEGKYENGQAFLQTGDVTLLR
jgi:gliding motility-associated-like protein